MRLLQLTNICLLMTLTVGFRWTPGKSWDVSIEQSTLWIELDEEFYADDGFGDKVDDLKGELATLKDLPPELQKAEIWRIILAEFASVETSFLRLRLKPGQVESIDAENDEVYDEEYAATRTIKVKVGSSQGAASGYAQTETDGEQIVGCNVVMAKRTLSDPKFLTGVLVHELMHCLGFVHQQEDYNSILSYSNSGTTLSLEERMAITYLYPLDPAFAEESPTFGMACSPAE
jgi:hypothetical protein